MVACAELGRERQLEELPNSTSTAWVIPFHPVVEPRGWGQIQPQVIGCSGGSGVEFVSKLVQTLTGHRRAYNLVKNEAHSGPSSTLNPRFPPRAPTVTHIPRAARMLLFAIKLSFALVESSPLIPTKTVLGNPPQHLAACCCRLPVWDWIGELLSGDRFVFFGGGRYWQSASNHGVRHISELLVGFSTVNSVSKPKSSGTIGASVGVSPRLGASALIGIFLLYEMPKHVDASPLTKPRSLVLDSTTMTNVRLKVHQSQPLSFLNSSNPHI